MQPGSGLSISRREWQYFLPSDFQKKSTDLPQKPAFQMWIRCCMGTLGTSKVMVLLKTALHVYLKPNAKSCSE